MPDTPDMEKWQTQILEINLKGNPQLAEMIF